MPSSQSRFDDLAIASAPALFVVLWSSGFIGAKYGMPYAEPFTFLFLRMVAVTGLFGLIAWLWRVPWPRGADIFHNVVSGVLLQGVYLGGVFVALDHKMPVGIVALVVGLQPLLTSTIANRFLGERVLPRQWLGLLLGFIGIYLVVLDRTSGDTSLLAWMMSFISLFGITIGALYQKQFAGGGDLRASMPVQYAAAAVFFGAGMLLFETGSVHWTADFLFALAWLVLVLSCGAVYLLYILIRRSAAMRLASMFYLVPPVTALMSWAFFGEQLEFRSVAGMVICVAGVFLVNRNVIGRA